MSQTDPTWQEYDDDYDGDDDDDNGDDDDGDDVDDDGGDDGDDNDDDYDGVQEKADTEWKFARSKLWISYFEACNHHHHCHCHHHQRYSHGFWFIPIITKSYHGGVTTHLGTT